jgi:hypothetical protein
MDDGPVREGSCHQPFSPERRLNRDEEGAGGMDIHAARRIVRM